MCKGAHSSTSYKPSIPMRSPEWGSPGWKPARRKRFNILANRSIERIRSMCNGKGNGSSHPHAGNKLWYEAQEEQLHKDQDVCNSPWFWMKRLVANLLNCEAIRRLRENGIRDWFYWVSHPLFREDDLHEAPCRWAKLLRGVRVVLIGRN